MFAFRLLTILSPIEIKVLQSCDHLRQILCGCVGLWCRVNTALKETPSSFGLLALGPAMLFWPLWAQILSLTQLQIQTFIHRGQGCLNTSLQIQVQAQDTFLVIFRTQWPVSFPNFFYILRVIFKNKIFRLTEQMMMLICVSVCEERPKGLFSDASDRHSCWINRQRLMM